jgi:hypothetical protein
MKKAMLLTAVACVATFALPTMASATTWHIDKTASFSGSGLEATFKGATEVKCTSSTVVGKYETTTTGTVEFLFHGCTGPFGAACTTSGESSGTIRTTKLGLHNVILYHTIGSTPGVLITPNAETGTFAHFSCFGIPSTIHGNGVLATTSQFCGNKSSFLTIRIDTVAGLQTHTSSTGVTYGLTSTSGGGSSVKSTLDASVSSSFDWGESRTTTCT